jgi:hypothetical protein
VASKTTSAEIRDFRSRAEECARQAANANTKELRDNFLALEQKNGSEWRKGTRLRVT